MDTEKGVEVKKDNITDQEAIEYAKRGTAVIAEQEGIPQKYGITPQEAVEIYFTLNREINAYLEGKRTLYRIPGGEA